MLRRRVMTLIKGRLINVSNRLPVLIRNSASGARVERSSGGLATALNAAWRHQPGVWIGWAGPGQGPDVEHLLPKASRRRFHTLQAVARPDEGIAELYSGFANAVI